MDKDLSSLGSPRSEKSPSLSANAGEGNFQLMLSRTRAKSDPKRSVKEQSDDPLGTLKELHANILRMKNDEILEYESKIAELRESAENSPQQLEEMEARLAELQEELKCMSLEHKEEIQKLKQQIRGLNKEITKHVMDRDESKAAAQAIGDHKSKVIEYFARKSFSTGVVLDGLEKHNAKLEKDIEQKDEKITSLEAEKASVEAELGKSEKEIERLKTKLDGINQQEKKEAKKATREENWKQTIQQLQTALDKVKKERDGLQGKVKELEIELEKVRCEKTEAVQEKGKSKEGLVDTHAQMTGLYMGSVDKISAQYEAKLQEEVKKAEDQAHEEITKVINNTSAQLQAAKKYAHYVQEQRDKAVSQRDNIFAVAKDGIGEIRGALDSGKDNDEIKALLTKLEKSLTAERFK